MAVLAAAGSALPHAAVAVPVRPAAAAEAGLSPDEQRLLSLMDPKDRARYVLQRRLADEARMATLLTEVQAQRRETASSVINNVR